MFAIFFILVLINVPATIELSIHTKEDIKKVTESVKVKVGTLAGATELHEILFESNGKIMKKKHAFKSLL